MKKPAAPKMSASPEKRKASKRPVSRVTVRFDVGFSNNLFIRGEGAGLSWERGVLLKNVGPDEWVWEPEFGGNACEFKVLINDQIYEAGENHRLKEGAQIQYTPKF